ncbi:MAG: leucine-rich repeat protein [Corallococcus sp.]|nr:leucine-rich repeat protein [Corallococcus sp.]
MNKKFTVSLIALISIFAICVCAFCACNPEETTENFTVTFNLNGGKMEGINPSGKLKVKEGTSLNLADYLPAKTEYEFTGWKLGDTLYKIDDKITVTADITLTAQWKSAELPMYTVTFDVNGGTMAKTQIEVKQNTVINFADYVPTMESSNFVGWKIGGKVYDSAESYTVTGEVTFVAQWKLKPTDAAKFVFEQTSDGRGYILKGLAEGLNEENLVIPNEYENKPVVEIAQNVFYGSSGDSVKKVKNVNLTNCTELITIGSGNFSFLDELLTVDISGCSALEHVGDGCFRNCKNLVSVSLAECVSLRTLGSSCFSAVPKLDTIELTGLERLESIGAQSFSGYNGKDSDLNYIPVKVLDFTDCVSLTSIGQMSFWYLSEVQTLDFSNTQLATVDRQVIMGCSKLKTVALPATLNPETVANQTHNIKNLSEFVYDCDSLEQITVSKSSIYLCAENGVLYDIDKTVIFKYPTNSAFTQYTAPDTVKKVRAHAFENVENLTSIDLGVCAIEEMEFSSFSGCVNATLTVLFDSYGFYRDGSTVTLGNNWNKGVKQMQYGERYLYFDITVEGITDGAEVFSSTLDVTASAKYGDDNCIVTVTVKESVVEGNNGQYTIMLTEGENSVVIKAEFDGKKEERTYSVTYVNATPEIVTSLDKENVNTVSSFTVQLKAGGTAQTVAAADIKIVTNNGFSAPDYGDYEPPLNKIQTDEKTVTVTLTLSDWEMWGYDVSGEFMMKITVTLSSGEKIDAEYTMKYEG